MTSIQNPKSKVQNHIQLVPVLDLLGGVVVRGIAGLRSEYRPIQSRIVNSCEPRAVAAAFREHFGLMELYVAELDAIQGGTLDRRSIEGLVGDGFSLWLDAGCRTAADARAALDLGITRLVAGLESLAGPETLAEMLAECSPERVLFSLDMKAGEAIAPPGWSTQDPEAILEVALELGVTRVLLLDLAQVGVGQGIGTEALARTARSRREIQQLVVGGGVRGPDDLAALEELGADAVLVASALHDGRISGKQ